MTEEQLRAIKARADAATPGEWRFGQVAGGKFIFAPYDGYAPGYESILEAKAVKSDADLEFAASARKDVPALLAYIEELHADLRLHREERIRLRTENYRLSKEAKR